jgi:CubicO group peptidase (beta-lactamase class C family)
MKSPAGPVVLGRFRRPEGGGAWTASWVDTMRRMGRPAACWAAAASALVFGGAAASRQAPSAEDAVDRYVQAEMARQRIPGLSLAIVKDGRVVKMRGYGLANVELEVPATEHTIYQSGSVGKQFTAALILLLVEEGKLRLDDRLATFFPEGPASWRQITIRHLLTHTSGLPNYTDEAFDRRRDYSDKELVALAAKRPLEFAPGTRWRYSNTGYVLLGILVKRVTGRFYGELLAERIFRPLGMKTARVISEADIVKHRAAGYRLVDGELKNQEWVSPSLNTTADGSLYLSVLDLVQWDAALAAATFLTEASRRAWWTPVTLAGGGTYPYGMGWEVDVIRGRRVVGHGGSWQGFKTHILRVLDDRLTVIVLANLAEARQTAIALGVAGLVDAALTPPHLMAPNPADPRLGERLERVLRTVADPNGDVAPLAASGFAEAITPALRAQVASWLRQSRAITFVGCDELSALAIERYGAAVDRYCYLRLEEGERRGRAVTFWVTRADRVAGFSSYLY